MPKVFLRTAFLIGAAFGLRALLRPPFRSDGAGLDRIGTGERLRAPHRESASDRAQKRPGGGVLGGSASSSEPLAAGFAGRSAGHENDPGPKLGMLPEGAPTSVPADPLPTGAVLADSRAAASASTAIGEGRTEAGEAAPQDDATPNIIHGAAALRPGRGKAPR